MFGIPKAWSWVNDGLYVEIEGAAQVASSGIIGLLLINYIYSLIFRKTENDSWNITKWHHLIRILTVITLFLYFSNATVSAIMAFRVYPFREGTYLSCDLLSTCSIMLYQYTRSSLYLLIITRLPLAFTDSAYKYSTCFIYLLYFIVFVYTIAVTFGDVLYVDGVWSEFFCVWYVPPFMLIAMEVFDLIVVIVTLYLFTKPLIKLMRESLTLNHGRATYDQSMINLVVRYANLTTICLVSTFIGLFVFIVVDSIIFIIIDNLIVPVSIVMMTKYYRKVYDKLCGCCDGCWLKLCEKLINDPQQHVIDSFDIKQDFGYVELSYDNNNEN